MSHLPYTNYDFSICCFLFLTIDDLFDLVIADYLAKSFPCFDEF
jgi:hypothetical protein